MDRRTAQIVTFAFVACSASVGCGRVGFDARVDGALDGAVDGASDAPSGPSLVESHGAADPNVTSLSITFSALTPGNVLLLLGGGHLSQILTPTGGSTAWQRATYSTVNPNIELWYGVADGAGDTVTITATGVTGMSLWVGEWTGLATTNMLDAASSGNGGATPATAGSITTIDPDELVIFGATSYLPNTFGTPTAGPWTQYDVPIGDSMQRVWTRLAGAPGTFAPTVSQTANAWDAVIASFRTAP
jgi:hypothetical protein